MSATWFVANWPAILGDSSHGPTIRFARKPASIHGVPKTTWHVIETKLRLAGLTRDRLPIFSEEQVYGRPFNGDCFTLFRTDFHETFFVLSVGTSPVRHYLINTEGFTYARYIAEIVD